MEDTLISLLSFIEYNINNGKYDSRPLEPVILCIKKEIKRIFLEKTYEE